MDLVVWLIYGWDMLVLSAMQLIQGSDSTYPGKQTIQALQSGSPLGDVNVGL